MYDSMLSIGVLVKDFFLPLMLWLCLANLSSYLVAKRKFYDFSLKAIQLYLASLQNQNTEDKDKSTSNVINIDNFKK